MRKPMNTYRIGTDGMMILMKAKAKMRIIFSEVAGL